MFDLPPELMAAIADAPKDDTPRLAAADWLDEHDDPDSARFIRLQCRIAGRSGSAVRAARGEVLALTRRHRDRWLGPLAFLLRRWGPGVVIRRGFVSAVYGWGPADQAWPSLARHPALEEMCWGFGWEPASSLDALASLRALRVIVLPGAPGPTPNLIARLARLPALRVLRIGRIEPSLWRERLGWLDGLPAGERAAAVARLLGKNLSQTSAGPTVRARRIAAFPNTGTHVVELAARLPGLACLDTDGWDLPPSLPPGAFADLTTLRIRGGCVDVASGLPTVGLRVVEADAPASAAEGAALSALLARQTGLRHLSVRAANPAPPWVPPPANLRTLELPNLRPAPPRDGWASAGLPGGGVLRFPACLTRIDSGEVPSRWVWGEWPDDAPPNRWSPAVLAAEHAPPRDPQPRAWERTFGWGGCRAVARGEVILWGPRHTIRLTLTVGRERAEPWGEWLPRIVRACAPPVPDSESGQTG